MPKSSNKKVKGRRITREEDRLKILVSSVVLGYEDMLESIYAILAQDYVCKKAQTRNTKNTLCSSNIVPPAPSQ